jgi:hypothetical protein
VFGSGIACSSDCAGHNYFVVHVLASQVVCA